MKKFTQVAAWGIVLLMACNTPKTDKTIHTGKLPKQPNIVFILADDLGWADLPSYGNTFNEAPALQRLRQEGMLFNNAYAACPVCSPSRASIQSGQYPARVGVFDFIPGHWRPYESVTVPTNRTQYLPEEINTLGEAMKSAGYTTGYFGKWHLGYLLQHMPGNQGYDDWRVFQGGNFYNLKSTKNCLVPADTTLRDDQRLSEVLTDYSIRFLEKNKDKPFFLFLGHYDVHVQLDADKDLIDKYLKKPKTGQYPGNAVYAAMIEHLDNSVDRVLKKLRELNLDDNTIVIFYSDNGGKTSRYDGIPLLAKSKLSVYENSNLQYIATSNAPLRADKGSLYEGGIRVPFIIKWPGVIKAGATSKAAISSVDFFPTLMEVAGGSLPGGQIFDGVSFLPALQNRAVNKERPLFWHYPVYHHHVPASAVIQGDWKLIQRLDDNQVELYNLANDASETRNLSLAETEKTAKS